MQGNHAPLSAAVLTATLALGALAVSGCRTTGHAPGATRIDRLMNTYSALGTGRFVVVADFEDPVHMELVTFSATSPRAKFAHDDRGGRPETGRGCLKVTAASAADAVILSNRASSSWYLKRDWRGYDSLILAVKSPKRGISVDITISSGSDQNRTATGTTLRLRPGWNVLRLQLADVAEHIAIDDVRELRLRFPGVDGPTDLYLDDLILTADRATVFGEVNNTSGGLYVQRVAKRLNVGTGGSFELTFANGQIVRWFDLATDPHRLHNLVQGGTLGPTPVVLDDSPNSDTGFGPLGSAVLAEQRLLEATAVRVVIECVWYFVEDPDAPIDQRPRHRRLYTIYPTGELFVSVDATVANEVWSPPNVGLEITLAPPADGPHDVGIGSVPAATTTYAPYAWAGSSSQGGYLLYVVPTREATATIVTRTDPETHRLSLVATGGQPQAGLRSWHGVIVLRLDGRNATSHEAAATASAYAAPPKLDLELGSPSGTDAFGRNLEAGYDRATGSYVLVPEAGRLRLKLRSDNTRPVAPAFTVHGTAGLDAWVYVNYVLHVPTARDRTGNLIFQLPKGLPPQTPVEVLIRRPQGPSSP